MGIVNHHAIIVTGVTDEEAKRAHNIARNIFNDRLITDIVESVANYYSSFMIAPDGSKEGWGLSDEYDDKRDEFWAALEHISAVYAVEVQFGEIVDRVTRRL